MARQRAQLPLGGNPVGSRMDFLSGNGQQTGIRFAGHELMDNIATLLGLERARAVNEDAARFSEREGLSEQTPL